MGTQTVSSSTRTSILEIKTSGDEKVTKLRSASDEHISLLFQTEAPWYGYLHQASTYASLANLTFPQIPPVKYVDYLIFSRDSPTNGAAFRLDVPNMDWWREIRARIIMAQESYATLPMLCTLSKQDKH